MQQLPTPVTFPHLNWKIERAKMEKSQSEKLIGWKNLQIQKVVTYILEMCRVMVKNPPSPTSPTLAFIPF